MQSRLVILQGLYGCEQRNSCDMSKFLTLSVVMSAIVLLMPYSLSASAEVEEAEANPILVFGGGFPTLHVEEQAIFSALSNNPNFGVTMVGVNLIVTCTTVGQVADISITFVGSGEEVDHFKCVPVPQRIPNFVLFADQGRAGSQVSIAGMGFEADSFFDVFFDLTNVQHGVTDPGTFSSFFIVPPDASCGPHTVKVVDAVGTEATNTYTVTCPVGGMIMPVDISALFVASAMTNAVWIIPTIGGIAGTALALFKIKRKKQ